MQTGFYIQTTEPYQDLFVDGDRWSRGPDDQVFVYREGEDDPVAEVAAEYFVNIAEATEEVLTDTETDADDTPVQP